MKDEKMMSEFPDMKQRNAVCFNMFEDKKSMMKKADEGACNTKKKKKK